MPLTQEEIDGCRDAFLAFDKDRSGTIDVWELRQVLEGEYSHPKGATWLFLQWICPQVHTQPLTHRTTTLCFDAAMGQKPTEEELFQMISEVDDNMSGSIGTLHAPVYLSSLCCVAHEGSCGWCMEHTHTQTLVSS